MSIPHGICVDLETTITSKIPDHVRPPGQKRYETRIIEIGAVDWKNPSRTYQALVNPIPSDIPLQTTKDFFQHLQDTHQHPTRTINFWSRVLVRRRSLTRHMFSVEESPEVWLARQVDHRTKDFIRWHNSPGTGPAFVSEKEAVTGLIRFTMEHPEPTWLAHNGASFDFKVLQGCAERHSIRLPKHIQHIDTLKLFRKLLPGHKSYSQPILFQALFKKKYNAHVAIDDAKALSTLVAHAAGPSKTKIKHRKKKASAPAAKGCASPKKAMTINFLRRTPTATVRTSVQSASVLKLRGIGPKTAGALAAVQITTVAQLVKQYNKGGSAWLKGILPFGARWKIIAQSIMEA